ncbi:hypothetical protein CAOG_07858 [Capsaspora owczarzaki ATCC 30864]|uniref:Mediator complex subunit Med12 LCEWAV-domain domain-containing protein n=1 Tax=Capsaspora owczarzaki (strain ATCC 30864) TaxID=595528 RepID=A0A0D2WX94_CAPO3|nr:hypothetical protein CAOG_07858 [Capsaspora owczarzaki ATCC 30864]KJE97755.1 hypothetical protein CAOG_007858 [Capsaspora owczarzaki ATCC 30864]|eukprot:XP_004342943.1 hypothetical protein CAOG_07858 [Capsaspora owczarzaki ATCC 30864]
MSTGGPSGASIGGPPSGSTGASHALKPYELERPKRVELSAKLGIPDLFPQRRDQQEDVMNVETLAKGYNTQQAKAVDAEDGSWHSRAKDERILQLTLDGFRSIRKARASRAQIPDHDSHNVKGITYNRGPGQHMTLKEWFVEVESGSMTPSQLAASYPITDRKIVWNHFCDLRVEQRWPISLITWVVKFIFACDYNATQKTEFRTLSEELASHVCSATKAALQEFDKIPSAVMAQAGGGIPQSAPGSLAAPGHSPAPSSAAFAKGRTPGPGGSSTAAAAPAGTAEQAITVLNSHHARWQYFCRLLVALYVDGLVDRRKVFDCLISLVAQSNVRALALVVPLVVDFAELIALYQPFVRHMLTTCEKRLREFDDASANAMSGAAKSVLDSLPASQKSSAVTSPGHLLQSGVMLDELNKATSTRLMQMHQSYHPQVHMALILLMQSLIALCPDAQVAYGVRTFARISKVLVGAHLHASGDSTFKSCFRSTMSQLQRRVDLLFKYSQLTAASAQGAPGLSSGPMTAASGLRTAAATAAAAAAAAGASGAARNTGPPGNASSRLPPATAALPASGAKSSSASFVPAQLDPTLTWLQLAASSTSPFTPRVVQALELYPLLDETALLSASSASSASPSTPQRSDIAALYRTVFYQQPEPSIPGQRLAVQPRVVRALCEWAVHSHGVPDREFSRALTVVALLTHHARVLHSGKTGVLPAAESQTSRSLPTSTGKRRHQYTDFDSESHPSKQVRIEEPDGRITAVATASSSSTAAADANNNNNPLLWSLPSLTFPSPLQSVFLQYLDHQSIEWASLFRSSSLDRASTNPISTAPAGAPLPIQDTMRRLVLLFSELTSRRLFSHNAYVQTLISRGDMDCAIELHRRPPSAPLTLAQQRAVGHFALVQQLPVGLAHALDPEYSRLAQTFSASSTPNFRALFNVDDHAQDRSQRRVTLVGVRHAAAVASNEIATTRLHARLLVEWLNRISTQVHDPAVQAAYERNESHHMASQLDHKNGQFSERAHLPSVSPASPAMLTTPSPTFAYSERPNSAMGGLAMQSLGYASGFGISPPNSEPVLSNDFGMPSDGGQYLQPQSASLQSSAQRPGFASSHQHATAMFGTPVSIDTPLGTQGSTAASYSAMSAGPAASSPFASPNPASGGMHANTLPHSHQQAASGVPLQTLRTSLAHQHHQRQRAGWFARQFAVQLLPQMDSVDASHAPAVIDFADACDKLQDFSHHNRRQILSLVMDCLVAHIDRGRLLSSPHQQQQQQQQHQQSRLGATAVSTAPIVPGGISASANQRAKATASSSGLVPETLVRRLPWLAPEQLFELARLCLHLGCPDLLLRFLLLISNPQLAAHCSVQLLAGMLALVDSLPLLRDASPELMQNLALSLFEALPSLVMTETGTTAGATGWVATCSATEVELAAVFPPAISPILWSAPLARHAARFVERAIAFEPTLGASCPQHANRLPAVLRYGSSTARSSPGALDSSSTLSGGAVPPSGVHTMAAPSGVPGSTAESNYSTALSSTLLEHIRRSQPRTIDTVAIVQELTAAGRNVNNLTTAFVHQVLLVLSQAAAGPTSSAAAALDEPGAFRRPTPSASRPQNSSPSFLDDPSLAPEPTSVGFVASPFPTTHSGATPVEALSDPMMDDSEAHSQPTSATINNSGSLNHPTTTSTSRDDAAAAAAAAALDSGMMMDTTPAAPIRRHVVSSRRGHRPPHVIAALADGADWAQVLCELSDQLPIESSTTQVLASLVGVAAKLAPPKAATPTSALTAMMGNTQSASHPQPVAADSSNAGTSNSAGPDSSNPSVLGAVEASLVVGLCARGVLSVSRVVEEFLLPRMATLVEQLTAAARRSSSTVLLTTSGSGGATSASHGVSGVSSPAGALPTPSRLPSAASSSLGLSSSTNMASPNSISSAQSLVGARGGPPSVSAPTASWDMDVDDTQLGAQVHALLALTVALFGAGKRDATLEDWTLGQIVVLHGGLAAVRSDQLALLAVQLTCLARNHLWEAACLVARDLVLRHPVFDLPYAHVSRAFSAAFLPALTERALTPSDALTLSTRMLPNQSAEEYDSLAMPSLAGLTLWNIPQAWLRTRLYVHTLPSNTTAQQRRDVLDRLFDAIVDGFSHARQDPTVIPGVPPAHYLIQSLDHPCVMNGIVVELLDFWQVPGRDVLSCPLHRALLTARGMGTQLAPRRSPGQALASVFQQGRQISRSSVLVPSSLQTNQAPTSPLVVERAVFDLVISLLKASSLRAISASAISPSQLLSTLLARLQWHVEQWEAHVSAQQRAGAQSAIPQQPALAVMHLFPLPNEQAIDLALVLSLTSFILTYRDSSSTDDYYHRWITTLISVLHLDLHNVLSEIGDPYTQVIDMLSMMCSFVDPVENSMLNAGPNAADLASGSGRTTSLGPTQQHQQQQLQHQQHASNQKLRKHLNEEMCTLLPELRARCCRMFLAPGVQAVVSVASAGATGKAQQQQPAEQQASQQATPTTPAAVQAAQSEYVTVSANPRLQFFKPWEINEAYSSEYPLAWSWFHAQTADFRPFNSLMRLNAKHHQIRPKALLLEALHPTLLAAETDQLMLQSQATKGPQNSSSAAQNLDEWLMPMDVIELDDKGAIVGSSSESGHRPVAQWV